MKTKSMPAVQRGVCPYCGLDAFDGPNAHATREQCIQALRNETNRHRSRIKRIIMDRLQEVTNRIGGVIGYRLTLSAEETETLLKEIERQ